MRYEPQGSPRQGHADPVTDALARGLGIFSIALGAMELVGARTLARALGMEDHENLVRVYGLREVATGAAILVADDPTPWIWGRVAGDALDLATLARGTRRDNPQRHNVGLALLAVAGVTALDAICATKLSRESARPLPPVKDYRDRSGFPAGPSSARGAARGYVIPPDMRIPEAMRPMKSG